MAGQKRLLHDNTNSSQYPLEKLLGTPRFCKDCWPTQAVLAS
jgi:hypothetical protein